MEARLLLLIAWSPWEEGRLDFSTADSDGMLEQETLDRNKKAQFRTDCMWNEYAKS